MDSGMFLLDQMMRDFYICTAMNGSLEGLLTGFSFGSWV